MNLFNDLNIYTRCYENNRIVLLYSKSFEKCLRLFFFICLPFFSNFSLFTLDFLLSSFCTIIFLSFEDFKMITYFFRNNQFLEENLSFSYFYLILPFLRISLHILNYRFCKNLEYNEINSFLFVILLLFFSFLYIIISLW